jgi:hypothetical protein
MLLKETLLWLCIQMTLIHRFPGILELRIFVDMLLNLTSIPFYVSYEGTCARSRFFNNKEPVVQNWLTMKSWRRNTGKPSSTATFLRAFHPMHFFTVKTPCVRLQAYFAFTNKNNLLRHNKTLCVTLHVHAPSTAVASHFWSDCD